MKSIVSMVFVEELSTLGLGCTAHQMSHLMGKPTICICETKGADQLRIFAVTAKLISALICFRYTDSTIPLLSKSKIFKLYSFSVTVQVGLCLTCSETTLLVFPRGGSNNTISPVTLYKLTTKARHKRCNSKNLQQGSLNQRLKINPKYIFNITNNIVS